MSKWVIIVTTGGLFAIGAVICGIVYLKKSKARHKHVLQITNSISVEVGKRNCISITRPIELYFIPPGNAKNDDMNKNFPRTKDFKEEGDNAKLHSTFEKTNDQPRHMRKLTGQNNTELNRSNDKPKPLHPNSTPSPDFREQVLITNTNMEGDIKELGHHSLDLPLITNEMMGSDEVEYGLGEGYMSSGEEEQLMALPEMYGGEEIESELNRRKRSTLSRERKQRSSMQKIIISSPEDLQNLLQASQSSELINFNERKYSISTTKIQLSNGDSADVIAPDMMVVILDYMFNEINAGLIELEDNFIEDRRKYFKEDLSTYISICKLFLKKKEEFVRVSCSSLMNLLDIPQSLMKQTLNTYLSNANKSDTVIRNIISSYSKVISCGKKQTICPKRLTREKLKIVLSYQCEKYRELISKYQSSYSMDLIQIMVTDYTYEEFGLDNDAIHVAIEKHHVHLFTEFDELLQNLTHFQSLTTVIKII